MAKYDDDKYLISHSIIRHSLTAVWNVLDNFEQFDNSESKYIIYFPLISLVYMCQDIVSYVTQISIKIVLYILCKMITTKVLFCFHS